MATVTSTLADLRVLFPGARGYLNSATCGLPPVAALEAMHSHLDEWRDGGACLLRWDIPVQRSRELAATLMGVGPSAVSVGSQVAVTAGTVAAAAPSGTRIVMPSGEFSSLTWPFVARGDLEIVQVDLAELPGVIREGDWVVASTVQSNDGRLLDLEAVAAAARTLGIFTFLDATQSLGWLPMDASRFDVVTAGAYKWLLCPRGTAFTAWSERALATVAPQNPNWYAGRDVGASLYMNDVDLASTARRHDVSPAWPCWPGAVPALELLVGAGVERIQDHNVGLANRLRAELGMEPSNSAIVSIRAEAGVMDRMSDAGIKCGYRDGRVRVGFHLYNDESEIAVVARVLGS